MKRNTLSLLTLAGIVPASFVLVGCTSSANEPKGLTGRSTTVARPASQTRWTDAKGQYRPDWRAGINVPAGYPKS